MRKMRIGVWDEEKEYVFRLAAFLQRFGKGRWEVFAFTQAQAVQVHLHKDSLDILIGTDKEALKEYENQKEMIKLWLKESKEQSKCSEEAWFELYRYQGAEKIGAYIYKILGEKNSNMDRVKQLVVMYSPVGRCGKTTFALDFIKETSYGRWLYIGLEDYSSFGCENLEQIQEVDTFLYYWKEHNAQQVQKMLVENNQIIITGSSFFDARQLEISDFEWLRYILQSFIKRIEIAKDGNINVLLYGAGIKSFEVTSWNERQADKKPVSSFVYKDIEYRFNQELYMGLIGDNRIENRKNVPLFSYIASIYNKETSKSDSLYLQQGELRISICVYVLL